MIAFAGPPVHPQLCLTLLLERSQQTDFPFPHSLPRFRFRFVQSLRSTPAAHTSALMSSQCLVNFTHWSVKLPLSLTLLTEAHLPFFPSGSRRSHLVKVKSWYLFLRIQRVFKYITCRPCHRARHRSRELNRAKTQIKCISSAHLSSMH